MSHMDAKVESMDERLQRLHREQAKQSQCTVATWQSIAELEQRLQEAEASR